MATVSAKVALQEMLKSRQLHWAAGGYAFFIAENAILSENRTWLIEQLGDGAYHGVYGTFSTAATASIGYAYYKLSQQLKQQTAKGVTTKVAYAMIPKSRLAASWIFMTMGFTMASQAFPKLQIPVSSKFEVRCPFDFTDRKPQNDSGAASDRVELRGLERITRHSGLWSLGFMCAGASFLAPTAPLQVWWLGPSAVAWLGGSHTDSRFRRGMGGTLDPFYDSITSNIPFFAMITGRQGSVSQAFQELASDIKPLNAAVATFAATCFVASRGRVRI